VAVRVVTGVDARRCVDGVFRLQSKGLLRFRVEGVGELPDIRRYSTVEILGDSLPGWYA
jgi:hypothetical protein